MSRKRIALNAFADWVESHPTEQKDFNQWYNEYWHDYAQHCYDISRNVYIMHECIQQFERLLQPNMKFEDVIYHPTLLEKQRQICLSVQVLPDEFCDEVANSVYLQKCRNIFMRHFSNGDE